jgi:hypothetical protein
MRRFPPWLPLLLASLLVGCAPAEEAVAPEQSDDPVTAVDHSGSRYLYTWAGDPDEGDSDFLAVIDADPQSATYGEVLSTVPVGRSAGAHHSEHAMPAGTQLLVNGFTSGYSWVIDLADPLAPRVEAEFYGGGPWTYPHSFDRTPSGTVLTTMQYEGEDKSRPGALVELDPLGNFIRASAAADPIDPELHPYSLAIAPSIDRVVTTTSDMNMVHQGRSVQIWSLSGLELLHTLLLPEVEGEEVHLNPSEPRFLPDGRSALVGTFNCGLYLLEGIDSDSPSMRHLWTFERDRGSMQECGLAVLEGDYWVQTVEKTGSLVVLDVSDATSPVRVDELRFVEGTLPHWLAAEPGGDRLVLTGYGPLQGFVVLLRLDPGTGELSLVEGFGTGTDIPGVDMNRAEWPHGSSGPAQPHGTVFSRR